jgi:hypothetical protein
MELSKKQAEFWGIFIFIMVLVAITVLLIDFQLKGAILEQAIRVRREIDTWNKDKNGPDTAGSNANGDNPNAPVDSPIPTNVLVCEPTRMETGNVPNGATPQTTDTHERRPTVNRRTSANPAVQSGAKRVGTRKAT